MKYEIEGSRIDGLIEKARYIIDILGGKASKETISKGWKFHGEAWSTFPFIMSDIKATDNPIVVKSTSFGEDNKYCLAASMDFRSKHNWILNDAEFVVIALRSYVSGKIHLEKSEMKSFKRLIDFDINEIDENDLISMSTAIEMVEPKYKELCEIVKNDPKYLTHEKNNDSNNQHSHKAKEVYNPFCIKSVAKFVAKFGAIYLCIVCAVAFAHYSVYS